MQKQNKDQIHRQIIRKYLHCETEIEKNWGLKLHAEAVNKQIEDSYFCSGLQY